MWGATNHTARSPPGRRISIHAPRVGRDLPAPRAYTPLPHFNPRAPCGARRRTVAVADRLVRFQSTRPVWGATHGRDRRVEQLQISIHAPRVGRDGRPFGRWTGADISIHAPRVGRDRGRRGTAGVVPDFNPRAPCGARRCRHDAAICVNLISIHAPRVGRDKILVVQPPALKISIHAPRVGRDPIQVCPSQVYLISIHAPRVGRDVDIAIDDALDRISIHAPRVWHGRRMEFFASNASDFNPRAPCGARHGWRRRGSLPASFQSTRPVWGATNDKRIIMPRMRISIHAPRVGRDLRPARRLRRAPHFNPRAPCGARRRPRAESGWLRNFNPRAPCGARQARGRGSLSSVYFNPRAPCGARLPTLPRPCTPSYFNPRAPCGARRSERARRASRWQFQSTRPVWGATASNEQKDMNIQISIHAPRVGRDVKWFNHWTAKGISIHAPRVGRDADRVCIAPKTGISIHAPRVGRDLCQPDRLAWAGHFNPRAPCGARPTALAITKT